MNPISLTAYAKRRGVSQVAVTKAIATGRLADSVVRDAQGVPKIADPELADREWSTNTRPRVDQPSPIRRADDVPDYMVSRVLREAAAARREAAMAELAEMDLALRRDELVAVAEVRADLIARYTMVRTRILGVPTRVAQRLPHVATQVVPVVDELLREALEELATDSDGAGDDDA